MVNTTGSHGHPSNLAIWGCLIGLVATGLALAYLPMGKAIAIGLILAVAVVKATLVTRYYMHLRTETLLIHAIAVVPVLLLIGLAFTLMPDVILGR